MPNDGLIGNSIVDMLGKQKEINENVSRISKLLKIIQVTNAPEQCVIGLLKTQDRLKSVNASRGMLLDDISEWLQCNGLTCNSANAEEHETKLNTIFEILSSDTSQEGK